MESEEVEDNQSAEETEMTYSDAREASPKSNPLLSKQTFKNSEEPECKVEEINYEDDIEKLSTSEDDGKEAEEEDRGRQADGGESIRVWLQKISEMQTEIQRKLTLDKNHQPNTHSFADFPIKPANVQNPSRVVKYQDLPYMGEMTLDNSKPRRGRKPKKADICHLIYKNYGTIFPGTPNPRSLMDKDGKKGEESGKSDVQNRIISSLLEKRLTQDSKRKNEGRKGKKVSNRDGLKPQFPKSSFLQPGVPTGSAAKSPLGNPWVESSSWRTATFSPGLEKSEAKREVNPADYSPASEVPKDQSEPLNLCVRDLNQLKIRLFRKGEDLYYPEVKSEPASEDETELADTPSSNSSQASPDIGSESAKESPNGCVYWPNANQLFIHPVALQQQLLYYQKLAEKNAPKKADSQSEAVAERPELFFNPPQIYVKPQDVLLNPDCLKAPELTSKPDHQKVGKQEDQTRRKEKKELAEKKRIAASERVPTKRKRSAIFIPPIPPENQTNPATEVSICKFKFTGGAKPSLQEKKMLSVDSGGNFRYYSGTGDKSMRGYEFFPRETLQQQIGNGQGSSTGAFLQASGEKIHPGLLDPAGGKGHSDFMLTPELPSCNVPAGGGESSSRIKKRKTRKSLQREKLEQTFKEKGFLIQTQQLESAEGATYCKFRQLRKFTRYLFRSWKDYLPGNVAEGQEAQPEGDPVSEQELEVLSRLAQEADGAGT